MNERPTEYSACDALARVTALYAAQKKKFTVEFVGEDPEAVALKADPAETSAASGEYPASVAADTAKA